MSPSPIAATKIIIDTDPGGDDIFAILWALSLVRQQHAELVAITTAVGNVAAHQTFRNSNQILELTGFSNIPVGRGVLIQEDSKDAAHIHGADGMGNLSRILPPSTSDYESAIMADELLIEQLNSNPGTITIVAIGPLTNLAAAEIKQPGILKQAKEVVVMGGAFHCSGNVTPIAEFNVWFNPKAAQVVFDSRDDIVVLPLDVTQNLVFTQEMAKAVIEPNPHSQLARFIVQLCQFMVETALKYRETSGELGFLIHDAATLGYLFYPDTLVMQRAKIRIETQGEWTKGQALIDTRQCAKPNSNAWVALQVDAIKFFTNFIEDLKYLIAE
ncbi:Inosine-uridine preferring nucleoside hydrolase superfamily [Synechococcus sp. PCC 7335]|uniref:nucleoside hydrolase n=1 Tax=Synechococcus sp. (strain ATCC 29403 / PCC 7335) TaxID=91464 RepID=UPI00017EC3BD|nr:nucleoside hydrolase [Synechococcus sp. PCC 7335]EDX87785.1 Inosine-uridine preferring nucleoside hydrolase superfamily [Synechococcus sp. PCC 7335]